MNARARNLNSEHEEVPTQVTNLKNYQISKAQMILGWTLVGLMLVLVYTFGFYSGRQNGVELALTEQSVPRLRLPIENPKARAALVAPVISQLTNNTHPETTRFDFTESRSTLSANEGLMKNEQSAPTTEVISVEKENLSAGFVAKAAEEIIANPAEKKIEASNQQLNEIKETALAPQSLAERVAKVEISQTLVTSPTKPEVAKTEIINTPIKSTSNEIASADTKKLNASLAKPKESLIVKKVLIEPKTKALPAKNGFFVQVGAPDSISKAQQMVAKLKSKGVTAAIRDASVNGKMHYRVLVGPFSSRNGAQDSKNQIIKSGVGLGEPFIKEL